ncbi:hypothetical protein CBM2589_B300025 [Cupriavidus taiwanensis]|uniref:Uncharacterized protein n=1 Tax=Cupriavidus taiwanensis TaxID=164546 RepID=A0A976A2N3_9BURK|nr:hypothetical protein CBM2589_B300025 [Cupriavidus taiwanensis]
MAGRRRARAGARRGLLRTPGQPPLPGQLVDAQARAARLPAGARLLPRCVRPCAAADQSGLRRLHGSLRQGRPEGGGAGRAGNAVAPVLVHRRIRPDPHAARAPHLWRRHRLEPGRVDLQPGLGQPQPDRLRRAPHHAHALPHRYLPEDLLRDRQLRAIVRRHPPGFRAAVRSPARAADAGRGRHRRGRPGAQRRHPRRLGRYRRHLIRPSARKPGAPCPCLIPRFVKQCRHARRPGAGGPAVRMVRIVRTTRPSFFPGTRSSPP